MGFLSARTAACAAVCVGAFLSASGLLQFHEVFFSPSGAASAPSQPSAPTLGPARQYDRLVVVLIDALRADMVLGSEAMYGHAHGPDGISDLSQHMQFTRSLLASGQAVGYVAHASVPTVTMPRLKALLSGKPPAFIDILKNFNSVALEDENVVQLMRENGFRIVFYGDDTWLKLFPDSFQRAEGTSGFYTRDTVEVDDNVTRHLRDELDPLMEHPKSRDWDVLVLHYLGLDHVGHLRGPRSPMMKDKLHEMDGVFKLVYSSVRSQDDLRLRKDASANPTLIALCSDHGMSEIGNHGGATVEESSALMAFLRGDGIPLRPHSDPKIQNRRLQVDLVPTIATLFGLRIPVYNSGLLLEDVVARSTSEGSKMSTLKALYANAIQLRQLALLKFPGSTKGPEFDEVVERANKLFDPQFSRSDDEENALILLLRTLCQQLQEMVTRSDGSEYKPALVGTGVATLVLCATGAMIFAVRARAARQPPVVQLTLVSKVAMGAFVATIVSLSSTSSIENEHATVFFVTTSILASMCIDSARYQSEPSQRPSIAVLFVCLVCLRILRERSQVINFARLNGITVDSSLPGNEFVTDDSLSVWFTGPLLGFLRLPNEIYLIVISFGVVIGVTWRRSERLGWIWLCASITVFFTGMIVNMWCSHLVAKDRERASVDFAARCVYASAITMIGLVVALKDTDFPSAVEMMLWLVSCMVQNSNNLPSLAVLCLLLQLLSAVFSTQNVDKFFSGLLSVWIASSSFFALGNSHLVTTIDISQSYHGLGEYSQAIVGVLTFVNVFSGPLLVFARASNWVRDPMTRVKQGKDTFCEEIVWITISYQAYRMAFYTFIVYLMRFHLFIWSVFAPKFHQAVIPAPYLTQKEENRHDSPSLTSGVNSSSMASYFQGGDSIELLSAQGKTPASTWKLQGKIVKSFDKAIKGNAFQMDGSSETRMQLPKTPTASTSLLGLTQRFLVLQLLVPHTRSFSLEIGFSDFQKIRRRLIFASAFRETTMTALHVQIPIDASVPRDQWMNLVFDLQVLSENYFPGCSFRSMESICVSGSCRLKRVFTMKEAPYCPAVEARLGLTTLASKGHRPASNEPMAIATSVGIFTEMQEIPRKFVFSANPTLLPVPTEYFPVKSVRDHMATNSVQPSQCRSSGGTHATSKGMVSKAKPTNTRSAISVGVMTTRVKTNKSSSQGMTCSNGLTLTSPMETLETTDRHHTVVAESVVVGSSSIIQPSPPTPASDKSGSCNELDYVEAQRCSEDGVLERSGPSLPAELSSVPIHDDVDRINRSTDVAFKRNWLRQNIMAEIQFRLDQLTEETDNEAELDRAMFLQHIANSTDSEAHSKHRGSSDSASLITKAQRNAFSFPNDPKQSQVEPWEDVDLLRSPEPMVLQRVFAVKKPEISFSSSIFTFKRGEATQSTEPDVGEDEDQPVAKRRDLFDWDSLLGDSRSKSDTFAETNKSIQAEKVRLSCTRVSVSNQVSSELIDDDGIRRDHVNCLDGQTVGVSRGISKMIFSPDEVLGKVRSNGCHATKSSSKDTCEKNELGVHKLKKSESPRSPGAESTFEFALSPSPTFLGRSRGMKTDELGLKCQSKSTPPAMSEGAMSLDMTEDLRMLERSRCQLLSDFEVERRTDRERRSSSDCGTSFDEFEMKSKSPLPTKKNPVEELRLKESISSLSLSTTVINTVFARTENLQSSGMDTSAIIRELETETRTPLGIPLPRILPSSDGRLASLLESTDWSHLPMSSVVSTSRPKISTTNCRDQTHDKAPGTRQKQGESSCATSLELIYDPILGCYYDPVGKRYYTLAI